MKTARLFSIRALILSAVLASPLAAIAQQGTEFPPGEVNALVSQARELVEAMKKGDADAVIRLTHPGIIKLFGSREKFEATTR